MMSYRERKEEGKGIRKGRSWGKERERERLEEGKENERERGGLEEGKGRGRGKER